jgi:hypothetical protein
MVKLLTDMTHTARDECMSYAGLIDHETASSADVALWTDAEVTAALESAASARRKGHTRGRPAA